MMSFSPRTIDSQALAVEGFRAMELHKITQLVVEENGNYTGMVHLHDILKEGIF
jgi:arabinose-5-phosphate isomerase